MFFLKGRRFKNMKTSDLVKIVGICCIVLMVCLEPMAQLAYRIKIGEWLWNKKEYMAFESHPWLVGIPKANFQMERKKLKISHNHDGYRGPEIGPKQENVKRIVLYGGSSTYGVKVSDHETWAFLLSQDLGPGFEVVNAGVPGYSSAEAIIQTALQQFDLKPDMAVYYLGWNDIRNQKVPNLKSDYSNFHGKSQYGQLGLNRVENYSAIYRLFEKFSSKNLKFTYQAVEKWDEKAIAIYKYNLETLIAINHSKGVRTVFIPQILNDHLFVGDEANFWIPYIPAGKVPEIMRLYNETMLSVCEEKNITCASEVLKVVWGPADFIDEGHFSFLGNRKFSEVVAETIRSKNDRTA